MQTFHIFYFSEDFLYNLIVWKAVQSLTALVVGDSVPLNYHIYLALGVKFFEQTAEPPPPRRSLRQCMKQIEKYIFSGRQSFWGRCLCIVSHWFEGTGNETQLLNILQLGQIRLILPSKSLNYINMRWGSASYEQKWLVENVLFWMAFSRFTGETPSIQERLRCVWNKWCTH